MRACGECGEAVRGHGKTTARCLPCHRRYQRSPEGRQKQSEVSKRNWLDPEYRRRRSAGQVAAWKSGAFGSEEHLRRISEGASAAHACGDYDEMYASEEWREGVAERTRGLHAAGVFDHLGERGGTAILRVPGWSGITKSVRERDGYACAICGASEDGQAHDVHHKDYDRGNNDPSNLTTLCKVCHIGTTFGDREHWQALLTDAKLASEKER